MLASVLKEEGSRNIKWEIDLPYKLARILGIFLKYIKIGIHMNNKIIKFMNGDFELVVTVLLDNETVWLIQKQMALLFDRNEKTIRKHISNTFKD